MTPPPPSRPPSTAKFPVEIITAEKMSNIVEDAFSSPAATPPSVLFDRNARSISSITRLAKRRLSVCTELGNSDIEDSGRVIGSTSSNSKNRKSRVLDSFLHRFRRRRGLSVTDITSTEWCEKRMEFSLLLGGPKNTETFFKKRKESTETMKAGSARQMELEEEVVKRVKIEVESIEETQAVKFMKLTEAKKAGIARHMELKEEVVKRVKIDVESIEEMWAAKFMYFLWGTNQLLAEGLTRELPVVGFVEGVWMVGIIDEIRMPLVESKRIPILVDTKTRVRATPPAEPQMRNARLQLMCYKYLWDSLVAGKFPSQKFFIYFSLDPYYILSARVKQVTEKSGFPSQTLDDLVRYFKNRCCLLPRAQDQLLLRYELQEDRSLLGEDQFDYEPEWFESQIKSCVKFWQGEREAICTPAEERWKCKFCNFSRQCPANSNMDDSTIPSENKDFLSPEIPLKNELS